MRLEETKKEVKLLQPKIDIVFQSLFNKKNEEITKSFIEYYIIGRDCIQNKCKEEKNIQEQKEW